MRRKRVENQQDSRILAYVDAGLKRRVEAYAIARGVSVSLAIKSLITHGLGAEMGEIAPEAVAHA